VVGGAVGGALFASVYHLFVRCITRLSDLYSLGSAVMIDRGISIGDAQMAGASPLLHARAQ
jgi:hypothetical protein